ncbi:MAG: FGGY family carbohydrate kinase, partial [Eubacteriales bacterium]
MKVIGLDIGTTKICVIVIETENGEVLRTVTSDNDTQITGSDSFERIQSPDLILEKCFSLVKELTDAFADIACIGITGQMHGILYLDKKGEAISPLYFWQDESGNEPFNETQSYAEYLTELTGYKMATGFGGTTYFCHSNNGKVPANAVKFCTIHDY